MLSHSMSRNGQLHLRIPAALGALSVSSLELRFGQRIPPHSHDTHQLAWSERGVLAVTIAARTWVLPPTRALWIPSNLVHAVEASSPATMHGVYFRRRSAPVRWKEPTVVAVAPLLAELIRHVARHPGRGRVATHARALLGSLLQPLVTESIDLPMPRDPRALRVADVLAKNPADRRTLARLGRDAGASARTLARLFQFETGLTFGRWRSLLRVRAALAPLSEGCAVAEVAERVGYESASAFVAAFRRRTGATPGAYFARG